MSRFVDIEAKVDDSDDSDDSEEEREAVERDMEEFNYDDAEINTVNNVIANMNARAELDEDQDFEGFLDGILGRCNLEEELSAPRESITTDLDGWIMAVQPGSDEDPLWRVDCRVSHPSMLTVFNATTHRGEKKIGLEDIAVMAIYRMASNEHAIRLAFTRGSIRGHIYVECQMNRTVQHLLTKVPGIKTVQGGIKMKYIPHRDQTMLLTMKNVSNGIEQRSWVRVRRGLYQGDEGLVLAVHDWGVTVLLVPRIGHDDMSKKRKSTLIRPVPRLIEEDSADSMVSGIRRDITIEHGLVCKAFDLVSVNRNATDMPFQLFQEFMRSRHPIFKHVNLIRPREWQVNVDDAIIDIATGENGVVKAITDEGVEAIKSEGRLVFVPWNLLQKSMQTGDQVTITAGARTGTSGWVVAVRGSIATVASIKCEGGIKGNNDDVEHVEVYVNFLTSTSSHPVFPTNDNKLQRGEESHNPQPRHPWIGIDVIISQNQHPMKGQMGVVADVIQPRTTTGPPRIVMRTLSYDPNIPYRTVTIDSNAVSTRILRHPLRGISNTNRLSYQSSNANDETARGQTPEAEEGEHSATPAWNPSAPDFTFESTSSEAASKSLTASHPLAHPFAHPALVGATVKTYVKDDAAGGSSKAKETTVYIDRSNGSCALRTRKYHEWHPLLLDSVTPKHPSPTHDNGLLLVIQGEHTGMYGRRLGHVKRNRVAYMVLELVNIQEGKADTLTGTIVELAAEDMCVVDEPASQKKLNTDLMKNSRLKYQTETKNRF